MNLDDMTLEEKLNFFKEEIKELVIPVICKKDKPLLNIGDSFYVVKEGRDRDDKKMAVRFVTDKDKRCSIVNEKESIELYNHIFGKVEVTGMYIGKRETSLTPLVSKSTIDISHIKYCFSGILANGYSWSDEVHEGVINPPYPPYSKDSENRYYLPYFNEYYCLYEEDALKAAKECHDAQRKKLEEFNKRNNTNFKYPWDDLGRNVDEM